MFPFFNHYPGTDLHEIDLAYLLKLSTDLEANNKTLLAWKTEHEAEYKNLLNKVNGLIDNLIDVVVPWDSSVAYRIFDIVEYQGTNYIAVQDVPVGTMITNTDYWQPANTVVEQINAISLVVSEIEDETSEFIIVQPRLSSTQVGGSCTIYTNGEFSMMIDCGESTESAELDSVMADLDIDYLDVLIITHWDGDHAGGAPHVIDTYCDSNTAIYRQMDIDFSYFGDNGTRALANYNWCIAAAATISNDMIIPVEDIVYDHKVVKLQFWNTNPSNLAVYNTALDEHLDSPTINNTCLITAVYLSGITVVDCGDIEFTCQSLYYDRIPKATIAKVPHHGVNLNGDVLFYNALSPEIGYLNYNLPVNFKNTYLARYLSYVRQFPVYTTESEGIRFKVKNGIVIQEGKTFSTYPFGQKTIRDALPSPYVRTNDKALNFATWTLDDLHTMMSASPVPIVFTLPSSSTCAELVQEANDLFGVSGRGFVVTSEGICTIYQTSGNLKTHKIRLFSGIGTGTDNRYLADMGNTFSTASNDTDITRAALYQNTLANITVDNASFDVPVIRKGTTLSFNYIRANSSATRFLLYIGTISSAAVVGNRFTLDPAAGTITKESFDSRGGADLTAAFNYFAK